MPSRAPPAKISDAEPVPARKAYRRAAPPDDAPYPMAVRLAFIFGVSALLWALIIATVVGVAGILGG